LSALECGLDRIAQEIAIKIEMSGEFPQIVEVLHSGVDHPQFHECLKLLGDQMCDTTAVTAEAASSSPVVFDANAIIDG
jgi:hypothetical protein